MNTPLKPMESLGRYELVRELGRGGMSVVYLARDTELGRKVAIKCVDTQDKLTAKLAARLRSEAKLLAQLNHPNIVQLYDVVEQDNTLGLVIEFVGGDTLTQRLKQAPTKEIRLKWLAEVADGLASAHQKGIAHCDLKTDNVLITNDNIAKIADFGIAKVKLDDYLEDDGLTRIDSVSGSYFSLSPEQAMGAAVDTRTDLFSLAVLAFQTLVGKHPFGDTHNKIALLQRVVSQAVEFDTSSRTILGVRLAEVIKNLLSKKPEERLYSADDVAELLRTSDLRTGSAPSNDETQEIPLVRLKSERKWLILNRTWLMPTAMLLAGFTIGALALKLLTLTQPKQEPIRYVALDEIKVTSLKGLNSSKNPLISTAVRHSAENAILSLVNIGLVTADDLNSNAGDLATKARAVGAEQVLRILVNCNASNCGVTLEERSGSKMAVTDKRNFVVPNSLTLFDLETEVTIRSLDILGGQAPTRTALTITDNDFSDYLDIYQQSKAGTASTLEHHKRVQAFISKYPRYLPAYTLAYQVANHIKLNTGSLKPIEQLKALIEAAPPTLVKSLSLKTILCNIAIVTNQIESAEAQLTQIRNMTSDAVAISELESALAYAKNDFDALLVLDRKNVQLRPSALNHYNLATSEYFMGNLEAATQQINAALELLPNYAYAKDLQATIAINQGDLAKAEAIYKNLISEHEDENYYVNYGLTLMLKSDFDSAITALSKALELNSKSALNRLNLADAYSLSKKSELAQKGYNTIIAMVSSPQTPQDYSYLAQAQAHTGQLANAVKTLKEANGKFPHIAELDYASAIVNTLVGNYVNATVDVQDSIAQGTSPIFFSFSWFKPLCNNKDFIQATSSATAKLCS